MKILNVRELLAPPSVTCDSLSELFKTQAPTGIYFPVGEYVFTRPLVIPRTVAVVFGDGPGATVLRAAPDAQIAPGVFVSADRGEISQLLTPHAAAPAGAVRVTELEWENGPLTFTPLASVPKRHDRVLRYSEYATPPSILPGDTVLLHDPKRSSYADMNYGSQTRDYHAGEFLEVTGVDLAQREIHLASGVQGVYATPDLILGLMPRSSALTVRDLTIMGTGRRDKEVALSVKNGRSVLIERVQAGATWEALIEVSRCVDCRLDRIAADQSSVFDGTHSGQQYAWPSPTARTWRSQARRWSASAAACRWQAATGSTAS